jgi:hypothetical protein
MFNYLCVFLNPQPPNWVLTENTELTEIEIKSILRFRVFREK